MKLFNKISAEEFSAKPADLIGNNWMIVAAGTREKFNMMTANWGALGVMWHKPVAIIVVRPQRYTKEFIDAGERFSLSFPPPEFKAATAKIGKVSGRDTDKVALSGLMPIFDEAGTPFFEQAHTVIFCRKLYAQPMAEQFFIDREPVEKWYPQCDFHTLYVAEIEKILTEVRE